MKPQLDTRFGACLVQSRAGLEREAFVGDLAEGLESMGRSSGNLVGLYRGRLRFSRVKVVRLRVLRSAS